MNYLSFILFVLILNTSCLQAQILTDTILNPNILSVKFAPEGFDLGYPILEKRSNTPLVLHFDVMGDTQPSLSYRLIHCDIDWKASQILTQDYLNKRFNEFYIEDYALSFSTKRNYTHYKAIVSPEQLKLSGNYVLQIFEESEPETLWLQQRFLFCEEQVNISVTVEKPNNSNYQSTHQRVNFEVDYNKNEFPQAHSNIKAIITQNLRWGNAQKFSPVFVTHNTLKFTQVTKKGLFAGNYEFPYFDSSNIWQKTHTIHIIEQDENNEVHCYLYPNDSAANNYFYLKDMNGNFTISAENTFSPNTEAEYIWVHFILKSKKLPNPVYVTGRFSQWQPSENYQLFYDDKQELYHVGLLLKQGVYNYTFVTENPEGKFENILGNYSETENDYYIFIYYKDECLQTDRLIGWIKANSFS